MRIEKEIEDMPSAYVPDDVKRWTLLDKFTNKLVDVGDDEFSTGLKNNYIKLRGQFIQVENKHKVWIDGIIER